MHYTFRGLYRDKELRMIVAKSLGGAAPHSTQRSGFTLLELMVVTSLIGLVSVMTLPKVRAIVDKTNVRSARVHVGNAVATTRAAAAQRGCRAVVHFSTTAGSTVWVTACPRQRPGPGTVDTLGPVESLAAKYAVTLTSTSDSIEYDATGLSRTNRTTTVWVTAMTGNKDSVVVNPIGKVLLW